MSTRCQIAIEGNEGVYLYKHSDGYPSGVLPFLKAYLPKFKKGRGFDPSYLMARLTGFILGAIEKENKAYDRKRKKQNLSPIFTGESFLGFGIDNEIHGDIEFFYKVNKDFSVSVYSDSKEGRILDGSSFLNMGLVRTITLDELEKMECPKYSDFSLETLKVRVKEPAKV